MIAHFAAQLKRLGGCALLTLALALLFIALGVSATHAQQDPFSELLKALPRAMQPSQQQRVSTDDSDGAYIRRALNFALETTRSGTETTWENPSTGHHGTVVPSPAFKTSTGQVCRGFERTQIIGTTVTKYKGTACREPNGSWNVSAERLVSPTTIAQAPAPSAGSYQPTTKVTEGLTLETQRLLTQLGFDPGPVDDAMGPRTKSAIEAFQRQQGLPVDGKVSEALVAQLRGATSSAVSAASQNQKEAKQALINALEELEWAITAKINYDVETVARAFSDAYDIERSRRIADFVIAPLAVIRQAIGLVSFGTNAKEIFANIGRAENVLQIASTLMGVAQLLKVGENLQLALDGPTYSLLTESMLKEAASAIDPSDYANVVKLHLYGVGSRRSPVVVRHQLAGTSQPSTEIVTGVRAVKRGITADVARLVKELSDKELPAEAPANEVLARLAEVTTAIKRSKQRNVAVSASSEGISGASPAIRIRLGSVGAREEIRRQALGDYDNEQAYQQSVEITSSIRAGTQVFGLFIGYKTPTGKLIAQADSEVFAPISVYQATMKKVYWTDARQQVNGLPHEMLLALPAELSNMWTLVDQTLSYIRKLVQPPRVASVQDKQGDTEPAQRLAILTPREAAAPPVQGSVVGSTGARPSPYWARRTVTSTGTMLFTPRSCKNCHPVAPGRRKIGPNLYGIFGRTAGTQKGYRYSKAMKDAGESGLVWNADTLYWFLAGPKKFLPRTKMVFPGLKSKADRLRAISWLKRVTGAPSTAATALTWSPTIPWLGARFRRDVPLSFLGKKYYLYSSDIDSVVPGGPADKAGLRPGDEINAIDGEVVAAAKDIAKIIASHKIGDTLQFHVGRQRERFTVPVVLGAKRLGPWELDTLADLGLRLSQMTPALRQQFQIGEDIEGVVITNVLQNSHARKVGIRPGDVIVEVQNERVTSPSDAAKKIKIRKSMRYASSVLLLVVRGRDQRFVRLRFLK